MTIDHFLTPVKIKIIIETPKKQHVVNLDETCSLRVVHTTAQSILGKAVRQIRHKIPVPSRETNSPQNTMNTSALYKPYTPSEWAIDKLCNEFGVVKEEERPGTFDGMPFIALVWVLHGYAFYVLTWGG